MPEPATASRPAVRGGREWRPDEQANGWAEQRMYDYDGRPVCWGSDGHGDGAKPESRSAT